MKDGGGAVLDAEEVGAGARVRLVTCKRLLTTPASNRLILVRKVPLWESPSAGEGNNTTWSLKKTAMV